MNESTFYSRLKAAVDPQRMHGSAFAITQRADLVELLSLYEQNIQTEESSNSNVMDIPKKHSLWRHKNGRFYVVIGVSNLDANRQEEYPTTVFYERLTTGSLCSRFLWRWHGSFTEIK